MRLLTQCALEVVQLCEVEEQSQEPFSVASVDARGAAACSVAERRSVRPSSGLGPESQFQRTETSFLPSNRRVLYPRQHLEAAHTDSHLMADRVGNALAHFFYHSA